MSEKIKVTEWNVNCQIGDGNGLHDLKSLFTTEKPASQIIVLTEFYKLEDYNEFEQH